MAADRDYKGVELEWEQLGRRGLARPAPEGEPVSGRSSVVEHQLPKLSVEGSIPFARSNNFNGLRAVGVRE
jgi:hypothetical protein